MFPAVLIYQLSFEQNLSGEKIAEVVFMICLDSLVLCVVFHSPPAVQEAGAFWLTNSPMCILSLVPLFVVSFPSGRMEKGSMGRKGKQAGSTENLGDVKAAGDITRQVVTGIWSMLEGLMGHVVNL